MKLVHIKIVFNPLISDVSFKEMIFFSIVLNIFHLQSTLDQFILFLYRLCFDISYSSDLEGHVSFYLHFESVITPSFCPSASFSHFDPPPPLPNSHWQNWVIHQSTGASQTVLLSLLSTYMYIPCIFSKSYFTITAVPYR